MRHSRLTSILISRYFLDLGAFEVNARHYGESRDISDETFALYFNLGQSTADVDLPILPPIDCDGDWVSQVELELNARRLDSGCLLRDSESLGNDSVGRWP